MPARDRWGAIEIGRRGVKPEAVVEQFAPDDPPFLRHRQADGDVCFALGKAEQPRGCHQLQIEIGISLR
jgi:hypothetical protein